jgi:nucleotide-binding universal stress UspA family protein
MVLTTAVVGWDDTAGARAALDWALATGMEIVLVRVVETTVSIVEAMASDSPAGAAQASLLDAVERLRQTHPHTTVSSEIVSGDPVDELARFSDETSLVIVGTDRQRAGGIRYRWSAGARLAAAARGTVVVVPVTPGRDGHGIVVGIDGSAAADAALDFAAAMAERTGQPIRAIHAWQEPPVWMDAQVPDDEYLDFLEKMYALILDDSLAAFTARNPGLRLQRRLVRGSPQAALLEAAEDAALVVVGNHSLRGLRRFLLGSVSRSVVINAPCPVAVVHAT